MNYLYSPWEDVAGYDNNNIEGSVTRHVGRMSCGRPAVRVSITPAVRERLQLSVSPTVAQRQPLPTAKRLPERMSDTHNFRCPHLRPCEDIKVVNMKVVNTK